MYMYIDVHIYICICICIYMSVYSVSLFLVTLALLSKKVDELICKIEIVAEVSLAIFFFSFFL
jgi:hypothetical protein